MYFQKILAAAVVTTWGSAIAMTTQLTYLRDRTIHQVELTSDDHITSSSQWDLPAEMDGRVEFGDLSCFSDAKFLTTITRVLPGAALNSSVSTLLLLDYANRSFEKLISDSKELLSGPITSPDKKYIAIARHQRSVNLHTLVIFRLADKDMTLAEAKGMNVPTGWTRDGNGIFVEKENTLTGRWEIAKYEINKKQFVSVREGVLPIFHPATDAIAYVSADRMMLHTLMPDGAVASPVKKTFIKKTISWRGSNEILFTSGVGYNDVIGISSLDSGKTRFVMVPGFGEIRGACATFK
jgi:hypothetical protein